MTNLQKLHLTGAAILAPTLAAFFRSGATADDVAVLPPLQKLYLGAMNGWDDGEELIDLLSRMVPGAGGQLSKVTLAGSSILGLVATGPRVRLFQRFIEDVGRQLEVTLSARRALPLNWTLMMLRRALAPRSVASPA